MEVNNGEKEPDKRRELMSGEGIESLSKLAERGDPESQFVLQMKKGHHSLGSTL